MACIHNLWMHSGAVGESYITVHGKFKPAGDVQIKVPIPDSFAKAIVDICQKALDIKEEEMRMEILGDNYAKSNDEVTK